MQAIPIETILSIIKYVDGNTALDMTLSDINGGFFSFIVGEDSYWKEQIQKDYSEFPSEFNLPLHFLTRENIVEKFEDRPFYHYLFLSRFAHKSSSFRFWKYSEDEFLLISENTFQAHFNSEVYDELFGEVEKPILKGKIMNKEGKISIYTSTFFKEVGITLKVRLDEIIGEQNSWIKFYTTLTNEKLGPLFPLTHTGHDYPPLNLLFHIESASTLQFPQTIVRSPFLGNENSFLDTFFPKEINPTQLKCKLSKLILAYFNLRKEIVNNILPY